MDSCNTTEEQEPAQGFEFEPERFFDSFVAVARLMLPRPREFFRQLPVSTSVKNPLAYLAVCSFLTGLFIANYAGAGFELFAILCCANITSTLIGSCVMHGLVKMLSGSQAPLAATLRVLAYASLLDTAAWVPVLSPLAKFYGMYLIYVGLQEQHRVSPRQSALALVIIVCLVTALAWAVMQAAPESFTESLKMLDPQQQGGPF